MLHTEDEFLVTWFCRIRAYLLTNLLQKETVVGGHIAFDGHESQLRELHIVDLAKGLIEAELDLLLVLVENSTFEGKTLSYFYH